MTEAVPVPAWIDGDYTAQEELVTLRLVQPHPGVRFEAAWKAEDLRITDDAITLTIPPRNGVLLKGTGLP